MTSQMHNSWSRDGPNMPHLQPNMPHLQPVMPVAGPAAAPARSLLARCLQLTGSVQSAVRGHSAVGTQLSSGRCGACFGPPAKTVSRRQLQVPCAGWRPHEGRQRRRPLSRIQQTKMAATQAPPAPAMVRHIEQGETVFSAAELHVVRARLLCRGPPSSQALKLSCWQAVVPIGRVPLDILLPYYSLVTRHRQVRAADQFPGAAAQPAGEAARAQRWSMRACTADTSEARPALSTHTRVHEAPPACVCVYQTCTRRWSCRSCAASTRSRARAPSPSCPGRRAPCTSASCPCALASATRMAGQVQLHASVCMACTCSGRAKPSADVERA